MRSLRPGGGGSLGGSVPVTLRAAYRQMLAGLGLLAGLAIAVLAVLITLDVVLRNLGVVNFPWLLEVSEYVVYFATLLAAPWVLHQGAHVRVDLLPTALPARWAGLVERLADGLGLVVSLVLARHGGRIAWDAYERGDVLFKELVIPEWPILAAIPVAGVLLAVEFALRLRRAGGGGDDASAGGA
ncbi:MAG: TRAP transporter small permease [Rhodospirillales bacterium]|nr:TRAP transporter small permease [Rhodospirillales bacterium]MDH3916595.1 TRAP transporter small permease [Rhodospirillales bacterium]MDH3967444.1 TRAP transporter small permease [Rhodospirillales bacterium]